mgnify:FL=1
MGMYEFGPISLTVHENKYSKVETLDENKDGFKLLKSEGEKKKMKEVKYSYVHNDKEIVFLLGYVKSETHFHISRIENVTGDEVSGKYLPKVFMAMEDDLRKEGITYITTDAITRLGPILVQRYGFTQVNVPSRKELKHEPDSYKKDKSLFFEKHL